jgi:hypothetical protein
MRRTRTSNGGYTVISIGDPSHVIQSLVQLDHGAISRHPRAIDRVIPNHQTAPHDGFR